MSNSPIVEQLYVKWRNKYLRSYQDGFYIYYKEPKDKVAEMTCSEAHGYGMLISVLKRNQQDFDGLYRYFVRWQNHKGLIQWQQREQRNKHGVCVFEPGNEGGEHCATDGDVDICTALFLAAKLWHRGGAQGEIDYLAAATKLAECIWTYCINPQTFMPLIGDWVHPGDNAYRLTRPSDFILSGYLVFYQNDVARKQQWGNVINAIINCCQHQHSLNSQTGLIADFLQLDHQGRYSPAKGEVLESKHDGAYNWNSCRVPWRLAHYYMLTREDRLLPLLKTQANFFASQLAKGERGERIKAGYKLHGKPLESYTDMAFVAPVSFLFWVLGWQDQQTEVLHEMNDMADLTYFGETIALLCILDANVPY